MNTIHKIVLISLCFSLFACTSDQQKEKALLGCWQLVDDESFSNHWDRNFFLLFGSNSELKFIHSHNGFNDSKRKITYEVKDDIVILKGLIVGIDDTTAVHVEEKCSYTIDNGLLLLIEVDTKDTLLYQRCSNEVDSALQHIIESPR